MQDIVFSTGKNIQSDISQQFDKDIILSNSCSNIINNVKNYKQEKTKKNMQSLSNPLFKRYKTQIYNRQYYKLKNKVNFKNLLKPKNFITNFVTYFITLVTLLKSNLCTPFFKSKQITSPNLKRRKILSVKLMKRRKNITDKINCKMRFKILECKQNKTLTSKCTPDNEILLPIILNNNKCLLSLDTGAAYTVMSANVLKKLNYNYKEDYKAMPKKQLYGVTGLKLELEDDRILPLYIPSFGVIDFRVSVTKANNVLLGGRDLFAKTKMSIHHFKGNKWQISFEKGKQIDIISSPTYKINKWSKIQNNIVVKSKTNHTNINKTSINRVKNEKIHKEINNFRKILKASNIHKIYQQSVATNTFEGFLKLLEKTELNLNLRQLLIVITKCITKNNNLKLPLNNHNEIFLLSKTSAEKITKNIDFYCKGFTHAPRFSNFSNLKNIFFTAKNFKNFNIYLSHANPEQLLAAEIELYLHLTNITRDSHKTLEKICKSHTIQNINIMDNTEDIKTDTTPCLNNKLLNIQNTYNTTPLNKTNATIQTLSNTPPLHGTIINTKNPFNTIPLKTNEIKIKKSNNIPLHRNNIKTRYIYKSIPLNKNSVKIKDNFTFIPLHRNSITYLKHTSNTIPFNWKSITTLKHTFNAIPLNRNSITTLKHTFDTIPLNRSSIKNLKHTSNIIPLNRSSITNLKNTYNTIPLNRSSITNLKHTYNNIPLKRNNITYIQNFFNTIPLNENSITYLKNKLNTIPLNGNISNIKHILNTLSLNKENNIYNNILQNKNNKKIQNIQNTPPLLGKNNTNISTKNTDILDDEQLIEDINNPKLGISLDDFYDPTIQTLQSIKNDLDIKDENLKDKIAQILLETNTASNGEFDCGSTNTHIPAMDIELKPNITIPRNTKTYRLKQDDQAEIERFFGHLVKNGLAKPSDHKNNYGSPVFVVGKDDRRKRIIIDLRAVNKCIMPDTSASLPECFELLKTIVPKAKYCTSLDLRQCFYSLKASQKTIDSGILNVITNSGNFTLLRLATGLSATPSHLVSLLNKYLHEDDQGKLDIIKNLITYYDDLNLFSLQSESLEEHIEKVIKVLKRLQSIGLKLNLKKCKFFVDLEKESIRVLGYEISNNKITIPEKKLEALKKLKEPNNLKSLQSLLGSLNFFKNLFDLKVHHSMSILYKRISNFYWDKEASTHYKIIINALKTKAMEVKSPFSKSISLLYSDASQTALGGTLLSINAHDLLKKIYIPKLYFEKNDYAISFFERYKIPATYINKNKNFYQCVFDGLKSLHYNMYEKNIHELYKSIIINIIKQRDKNEEFFMALDSAKQRSYQDLSEKIVNIDPNENFVNNVHYNLICHSLSILIQRNIIIHLPHVQYVWTKQKFGNFEEDINIMYKNDKFYFLYITQNELLEQTTVFLTPQSIDGTLLKEHFYNMLQNETPDILSQKVRIIGYHSKSINYDLMKRTSVCFLELYAILENLIFFENSFEGNLIYVLTDSTVSKHLLNNSRLTQRSTKLQVLSQQILSWYKNKNINVLSVPGKQNISDLFSRLLPEQKENVTLQSFNPEYKDELFTVHSLKNATIKNSNDKNIQTITNNILKIQNIKFPKIKKSKEYSVNAIKKINTDKAFFKQKVLQISNQVLHNNTLPFQSSTEFVNKFAEIYNKILDKPTFIQFQMQDKRCIDMNPNTIKKYKNKILLPNKLIFLIVALIHGTLNHCGKKKLYDFINNFYAVQNKKYLKAFVDKLVDSCLLCLRNKPNHIAYKKGSADYNLLNAPNQIICADLYEMSTLQNQIGGDKQKTKAILVIKDLYSKYVTLYPIEEKTQYAVIQRLSSYFQNNPLPRWFLSDNGKLFRGNDFTKFLQKLNVKVLNSAAEHAPSRGFIERQIQEVLMMIKNYNYENQDSISVCETMAKMGYALNTTPFKNTYLTPYNIHHMSLKNFNNLLDNETTKLLQPPYCDYTWTSLPDFIEQGKKLEEEVKTYREKYIKIKKDLVDKANKTRKRHSFQVHDFVLTKDFARSKFRPNYSLDVCQIIKINNFTCVLKNQITSQIYCRHVTQIKKINFDKLSKADLPLSLCNELKLMTTENIKDLFQYPVIMAKIRRSKRIKERKNKNINLPSDQTSSSDEGQILHDDDYFKYIPNLLDQAQAMSTIFE